MEALTIFKKAGLGDYLNPDSIKGYFNSMSPYAKSGLIGAGVGAAGMGLSSLMGGEEGESAGDKTSRILSNMLKGTALGGAAGLGGQAVYDHFLKPDAGLAPNIAALKDQLKKRTGQELDTQPFGVHHPLEQAAVSLTHQPTSVDATIGAGAGLVNNAMKDRSANKLFASLTEKGLDLKKEKILDPKTNKQVMYAPTHHDGIINALKGQVIDSPDTKQRLMERFVRSMNGKATRAQVTQMASALNYGNTANPNNFKSQIDALLSGGRAGTGQYKYTVGPQNRGIKIPFTDTRIGENNNKLNALKQWIVNKSVNTGGRVTGGFLGNNVARYGKAGLGGAALGMGAGAAGRGIVDTILAAKYAPEQIQAWSQM